MIAMVACTLYLLLEVFTVALRPSIAQPKQTQEKLTLRIGADDLLYTFVDLSE
jgi:hypothetical protein